MTEKDGGPGRPDAPKQDPAGAESPEDSAETSAPTSPGADAPETNPDGAAPEGAPPEHSAETSEGSPPEADAEDLDALASWEPPPSPGSLVVLIPNKHLRRGVLVAIPLLALLFGSGLILASQISVRNALQVFGITPTPGTDTPQNVQRGRVVALLTAGRRNALRLAVWDRIKKKHTRRYEATVALAGGPKGVHLDLVNTVAGPGQSLEANFRLPDLPPGRYRLRVRARLGDEPLAATIPAQVIRPRAGAGVAHGPGLVPIEKVKNPASADLLRRSVDADGLTLELLPSAGRRVMTELPEHLFVRTTDRQGRPRRARLWVRLATGRLLGTRPGESVGKPFVTGPAGLHVFSFVSRHPTLSFEIRYRPLRPAPILAPAPTDITPEVPTKPGTGAEPAPRPGAEEKGEGKEKEKGEGKGKGRANAKPGSPPTAPPLVAAGPIRTRTYTLDRRNAQAVLRPDALVIPAGRRFGVNAVSLTDSGPLYVDLLRDGLLAEAHAVRVQRHRARLHFTAPAQPGLFFLQGTDDFSNPGTGAITRTLFAAPRSTSLRKALPAIARAVLALLPKDAARTRAHISHLLAQGALERPGVHAPTAAAYLLSRLDRLRTPGAWLADTSQADTRALAKRKRRLQFVLLLGVGFTVLLLLGVILPLIWVNLSLARRGAAERDALMADFEATADPDALHAALETDHAADGGALITDLRSARERDLRYDRMRHRIQGLLVAVIILSTVTAIVGLLLRLGWGFAP